MKDPIPVNLAVEDPLSEAVLRRVLAECGGPWAIGSVFNRGGVGYLMRMINGFNNAARGVPFVVLADLDRAECAPVLVTEWLPHGRERNLVLRFAVREVEAWVLADRPSVGAFLGVRRELLPGTVEKINDPKRELIQLARRSKRSEILADLVPRPGSTAVVGRNYNARMSGFVATAWQPVRARRNSDSLNRAMTALAEFQPSWAN